MKGKEGRHRAKAPSHAAEPPVRPFFQAGRRGVPGRGCAGALPFLFLITHKQTAAALDAAAVCFSFAI